MQSHHLSGALSGALLIRLADMGAIGPSPRLAQRGLATHIGQASLSLCRSSRPGREVASHGRNAAGQRPPPMATGAVADLSGRFDRAAREAGHER
jgi:hypothetical protein